MKKLIVFLALMLTAGVLAGCETEQPIVIEDGFDRTTPECEADETVPCNTYVIQVPLQSGMDDPARSLEETNRDGRSRQCWTWNKAWPIDVYWARAMTPAIGLEWCGDPATDVVTSNNVRNCTSRAGSFVWDQPCTVNRGPLNQDHLDITGKWNYHYSALSYTRWVRFVADINVNEHGRVWGTLHLYSGVHL